MFVSRERVASVLAGGLFAVVLAALPIATDGQFPSGSAGDSPMGGVDVTSLIPDEVLDVIPEVCRGNADAEFETAVNCGISKFMECKGLMNVLDKFNDFMDFGMAGGGNATNVTDCFDVEETFCSIAGECPPCEDDFDVLTRCIVKESEDITDNVTELVDSCALTCS